MKCGKVGHTQSLQVSSTSSCLLKHLNTIFKFLKTVSSLTRVSEEIPPVFQILQLPEPGRQLCLMVDSACPVTFINSATWDGLNQPPLTPTNRELSAFEGQQIKPLGYFQTLVKHEGLPS